MKNFKFGFACCLLSGLVLSCGESNVENVSNEKDSDTIVKTADLSTDTLTDNLPELGEEIYESKTNRSLGEELMVITSVNGIKIGMNEDEVVSNIGDPEANSEGLEWGVDGRIHKFWYYADSSLVLEFVDSKMGEGYALEIIDIKDSCQFSTDRGIAIGSELELVQERYAKAIEIADNNVPDQIYLGDVANGGIFISICNGIVFKIRLGALIRC